MQDIEFYIGTDCPFCSQQCNNTLMGRGEFLYNYIYCPYCIINDEKIELSDSKFEIWLLNNKLISIIISENLGDKFYHSEYSPVQNEINLFSDYEDHEKDDVILPVWNLNKHLNILYNYISEHDNHNLTSKPGYYLKIKQILENSKITDLVKDKLLKIK